MIALPLSCNTKWFSQSIFQLKSIIEFAQTAVFLIDDAENDLQRPSPIKLCQHMIPQVHFISFLKFINCGDEGGMRIE